MDEMNKELAAEAAAAETETMESYEKELSNSMRQISAGDLVDGTVTGISETEVTVDLQYYAEGIIRPLDYSGDPSFSIKEDVHVGDEIKAVVLRMDDGHGNILLSKREADERLAWMTFQQMLEEKTPTEMKITEAVKGGVVGFLNGVRAFCPASRLSLEFVEDLSTWVGKVIPVRVITAEKEGRRLVVSAREELRAKREEEKARRISNITVGMVTEGTVQSLQTYGAFVSLGDGIDGLWDAAQGKMDGLVHISQITNEKRLKHPKEKLSVGDKVKVKVIALKDGKISLSMKALEENAPVEEVREERIVLPKSEDLTTNLGSLLKGIKLS